MRAKEGYMPIRYYRSGTCNWGVEIIKIQPFEAIDIGHFEWSDRGQIVKRGSAASKLTHGYNLSMNGMLVEDLIKLLEKLGEIYGSYGDMVAVVKREAGIA